MKIECFMIEPTGRQFQYLRRYTYVGVCPGTKNGHDASVPIEDGQYINDEQKWPRDDPRWPKRCTCGSEFQQSAEWQLFKLQQYRRADTGQVFSIHPSVRSAPPGAMWYATWNEDVPELCGPDGRSLMVMTPGGIWHIDARASNCTKPDDDKHKCWVRHGVAPCITVDKNGLTCAAGAGSIQCRDYHGFLKQGFLVD